MPNYDTTSKKISGYSIGSSGYTNGTYYGFFFNSIGDKIELVNPILDYQYYVDRNAYCESTTDNDHPNDIIKILDLGDNLYFGVYAFNYNGIIGLGMGTFTYKSNGKPSVIKYTDKSTADSLQGAYVPTYLIIQNHKESKGTYLTVVGLFEKGYRIPSKGDPELYIRDVAYNELVASPTFFYNSNFHIHLFDKNGIEISYDDIPEDLDDSKPSEPDGIIDDSSDPIDIPDLPNFDVNTSGLLTIWSPTTVELKTLGNFLWSDNIVQELSKLFSTPMESIVSLAMIPISPTVLGAKELFLGDKNTHVTMNYVKQYVQLDCGTLQLSNYYGSALDYDPYTTLSLYLPFVGIVPLTVDDCMGSNIRVVYNIDLATGNFTCFVKMTRDNLDSILNHYNGNCISNLPITASSYGNILTTLMSGAGSLIGAVSGGVGAVADVVSTTALATMSAKKQIQRSGNITGASGVLGVMKPYIIIERPIQSLASGYNKFVGYPSNITSTLGELKGFTQIESVISNELKCPQAEQDEIIRLLKEGVYL